MVALARLLLGFVLKDKADLSEESSDGAGRVGRVELWCGVTRSRIDARAGTAGRLGWGKGWNFTAMELGTPMDRSGALAVPAVGLRLGYHYWYIQSCSLFSFVHCSLPVNAEEKKTELGWLLQGLFTGNISVPFSLPK